MLMARPTVVSVLRKRRGCKQPATFLGWTTNPRNCLCEVCEIHKASLSRQCTSRPSHRPSHRRRRPADGLVIGHGKEGNTAPHRDKETHIPSGRCPDKQSQACTSLLSVLSCPPWEDVLRCVLTDDTKLAVQHRARREDERRVEDGIGHQNDELLRRKPAHVANRQPEAVPDEPEEQRIDVLQVVSETNLSWSNACLRFPLL